MEPQDADFLKREEKENKASSCLDEFMEKIGCEVLSIEESIKVIHDIHDEYEHDFLEEIQEVLEELCK